MKRAGINAARRFASLCTVAACVLAAGPAARADPVAEREQGFKMCKRASATIKEALARDDGAAVAAPAERIAEFAAQLPGLFPPDSRGGIFSAARADIWSRFPDFVEHSHDFEQAAHELARQARRDPADRAALSDGYRRLTGVCSSCHREYKRGR